MALLDDIFTLLSSASKTKGAESSCKQTSRLTSVVPQLPVTLTVVGFKSGPALELPGNTWRRVIKKQRREERVLYLYAQLHLPVCGSKTGAHAPVSVCLSVRPLISLC